MPTTPRSGACSMVREGVGYLSHMRTARAPAGGSAARAWASAIADGEKEYDVKQTVVALFSTEEEAESNADKVEDSLDDNWEVGDVTVDGALVTVEAIADEDDVEWSRIVDPF